MERIVRRRESFIWRGTEEVASTSWRPQKMSALLLDTHIWLWYAEGISNRLRPASVKKLDAAGLGDGLLVSPISVWGIGAQSAKGRITQTSRFRDWPR